MGTTKMIEHKHLICRCEVLNPPMKHDLLFMHKWFKELVDEIGMKVLAGPFVEYLDVPGNRGFTGVCIIETSHIAIHVWDEDMPSLMQVDVYTCGSLDIHKVFSKMKDFNPLKIEYKFLDRVTNLNEVNTGVIDNSSIFLK